jgi:hypothetical protein
MEKNELLIIPYSTTLIAVLFAFASVVEADTGAWTCRRVFFWRKVEFATRPIKKSSSVANPALVGHRFEELR